MLQKKWFNSKIVLTVMLVLVVCCFMTTDIWAAKKVKFLKANKNEYIRLLNECGCPDATSIGPALGLTRDEDVRFVRGITDFNGVTHKRFQQTLNGIPFWGIEAVISQDASGKVVNLHGDMVLNTKKDVTSIPAKLDPLGALKKMKANHKEQDLGAVWNFENEKYGTFIYVDEKDKAHLCYVVSFFADTDCGNPSRPVFLIDVKNGKVIHSFDSLAYAYDGTGPGGNLKIGQYTYGTTYPKFGVSINGSTCTMNYADCKTVDLNHGTSGTTPFSYTCYNNTHENINGGYCPMNDAQYFGQQIYNMYMSWYGVPPLTFQLMMRCHYSTNYENAFWNGSSMTFGDGYTTFYPLVALDVSAHEVSHGFTEQNSGLIYSGQSGGMNESYSDMAGEAAKYFVRGTNDFMCGYDIYKQAGKALRYLCNPPLDGKSIDHVSQYYAGLDVHYSSGIFNKAFCLIAQSSGWTTRMAFDVFTKANQLYWVPSSTFVQGAEGAVDAAVDLGYPCADVASAFAVVGITVTCPGPPQAPVAAFTASSTTIGVGQSVTFTDQSTNNPTSWSWTFESGTPATSTAQNPVVTYNTIGTWDVTLVATNAQGNDSEYKVDYINVTSVTYCASQGNSQTYEWISRVRVANLDNSSGASKYTDFTSKSANLTRGTSASVILNTGYSGSSYREYWRVWIDYNQDGDFADTGEQVFSKYGTTSVSGSFTPPTSAKVGSTRMRVSMRYGGYPTYCGSFSYGEVEDYTVNIQ